MAFRKWRLHEALHPSLERLGITQPAEIQEQAIPAILQGRDRIGPSKTGSGKTLAYLPPIITRLLARQGPRRSCRAAGSSVAGAAGRLKKSSRRAIVPACRSAR